MTFLLEFLEHEAPEKSALFAQLKCSETEAAILRAITRQYVQGDESVIVFDILSDLFGTESYGHLRHLTGIRNLIELGWVLHNSFTPPKMSDIATLELLHSSISLSPAFLKLLEDGNLDLVLPDIKPYDDPLEYLQDQFSRVELYQKLSGLKRNYAQNSPNISRIKSKLKLLEGRIQEKIEQTPIDLPLESFYADKHLNDKEQLIFLALLREEYTGTDENLREMNHLIDLVSSDDYERIKNRSLLEEGSTLIEDGIIDYEEMITPFGGISRSFFISEELLHGIIQHQKKTKKKEKIKLDMLVKEQEMFELIEPKKTIGDVVLAPQTRTMIETILHQVDKKVGTLLIEWGVKEKKSGIDARIIFYGPPGTGKTMTALAVAKSLKRQVLSFDCSKILSMYVGESEKNVRKIFDTYKEMAAKSKSEPVLLLNEADQFLSARSTGGGGSADKMHNQMQNIFLEQIERFDGILIATTNLLETIDPAFSRRFNYKIKFDKPTTAQRKLLWEKELPKNAPYSDDIDLSSLASFPLTGGQIALVIKNAAFSAATKEVPLLTQNDFLEQIKKEQSGSFDTEKSMGFLS